jgi:branched-chain amino acid transport system permease protein
LNIDLPALIVGAVLLAGLYATMSYGLALVYGVMKLVNLAHAGVMMWGAYAAFLCVARLGMSPFLAPVVIVPLFFVLGMLMQRYIVRRVMYAPPISSLLLLFGIWLIMQNIAYLVFSGDTRTITTPYTLMTFKLADISISVNRLVVFVVGLLALVGLQRFLGYTYMGKAIRATAQDGDASQLVGINTDRVMEVAFGISTALAALAGSLMALIFAFDPDFGRSHLLKGFCIVVLGGLESVVGVALGSLVLALAEALSILVVMPALQDFISFAILVVVLIVMPGGIMGLIGKLKPKGVFK